MKKVLSVILAVILIIGALPINAFAFGEKYVLCVYCEDRGLTDEERNFEIELDYKGYNVYSKSYDFEGDSYAYIKETKKELKDYYTDGLQIDNPVTLVSESSVTTTKDKFYIPSGNHTVSIRNNSDGTLTIAYDKNVDKRTILLNPNGGKLDDMSKEVIIGDPYGELPVPTREGYTFKGWYRSFIELSQVERFKPDAYGYYSIRISPPIEPFYNKIKVVEIGDTIVFDVTVEGAKPTCVDINDHPVSSHYYTIEENRIYGAIPFDNTYYSSNGTAKLDINCEEDYTDFTINDYKLFKQTDKIDAITAETIVEDIGDIKAAWQSNSPHSHYLWKIRGEEPTCTTDGTKDYYHCYGCGKNFEDENGEKEIADVNSWLPASKLGHNLGDWTVTAEAVAPTCAAAGKTAIETRKCTRCNYSETRGGDTVSATGNHTWNKGVVTTKATTKKKGVKTFTCSVCGTTRTEEIAKNNAKVKGRTAKVKNAKLKKKNQSVALKNAIEIKNAKGKVTFAKLSGNKKITINKNTGKVTVKKGIKKGTYSVKVKVKMAGDAENKAETKTVIFKIAVK